MTDIPPIILTLPPEVILHILSYLDLPDLEHLAQLSPLLSSLAQDPVLHRTRLLVVAPSRVHHALFAHGGALRPTVADLVHSGVMRGLGIERRWRTGLYFYSPQSVKHYETSLRLQRTHVRQVLSAYLHTSRSGSKIAAALRSLHSSRVLPDVESSSAAVSRILLPIVRQLKWSIQKDKLVKMVRDRVIAVSAGGGIITWFEGTGRSLLTEDERVRLAICPGVRKIVCFFESQGK